MNLFNLSAVLGLDKSEYENGLQEAKSDATSFGGAIGRALKDGAKVAATALTAATAAVTAFTASSVKTGTEFDSSMSQIAATLGLTMDDIKNNVDGAGDTFEALRDKAKEMGAATNFSASQAADGLNILAMSGFSASDSMNMLEDVLHLAAAGSMDMASAASYISGAMKGFNDASKDSGYYADLMAKGATLANTSVSQLGDAMSSGAAGAAAYSQSAESMTVALLRLAEQGEVGAAAGTSLSAAMKDLFTPTTQAAGALAELGVAAYDGEGKAKDFNTVVNELDAALSGYSEEQRNAYKQTIFGIQGLNAYNKMTVTSTKKQEEWSKALATAGDGAGEASKQYETMTDNLQGDIDIWNSALDGFKIEISDKVMPTVRSFVKLGSDGMSKITAAFQGSGFAGAASALGEVLGEVVTKITEILPTVVEAGSSLLTSFASALVDNADVLIQTGLDILLMVMEGIMNNSSMLSESIGSLIESIGTWLSEYGSTIVGHVVDLLVMVGGIIVENAPVLIENVMTMILELASALTNPENITALLEAVLSIVESIGNSIVENIPMLIEIINTLLTNITTFISENLPMFIETAVTIITALADGLIQALPDLMDKIPEIIDGIVTALLDLLPTIIETGVTLLTALIENLDEIITIICEKMPEIIDSVVNAIIELVPQIVDAGVQLLTALVDNLPTIINTICEKMPEIINSIIDALLELIPQIVDAGITLLTALVDNLPTIITNITEKLPEIITSIVDKVIELVPQIVDAGVTLLTALVDNLPEIITTIVGELPRIINGIIDKLTDLIPEIVAMGFDLLVSLLDNLPEIIVELVSKIPEIVTSIVNGFLEEGPSKLWDVGKQLIEGLWNGISSVGEWIKEKVGGFFSGIVGGIKSFLGIASPSKVFAGIGEMMDRGLVKGIDRYADLAVDAASAMAEEVTDAVNPNIDFTATAGVNGSGVDGAYDVNRSIVINVHGAEGQNVNELAEIISQKMAFAYSQEQAVWA